MSGLDFAATRFNATGGVSVPHPEGHDFRFSRDTASQVRDTVLPAVLRVAADGGADRYSRLGADKHDEVLVSTANLGAEQNPHRNLDGVVLRSTDEIETHTVGYYAETNTLRAGVFATRIPKARGNGYTLQRDEVTFNGELVSYRKAAFGGTSLDQLQASLTSQGSDINLQDNKGVVALFKGLLVSLFGDSKLEEFTTSSSKTYENQTPSVYKITSETFPHATLTQMPFEQMGLAIALGVYGRYHDDPWTLSATFINPTINGVQHTGEFRVSMRRENYSNKPTAISISFTQTGGDEVVSLTENNELATLVFGAAE